MRFAARCPPHIRQAGFDLCATTHCQVYSGVSKEHERTDEALLETAGLVLKYKDVLATTPYHSSNGGYTESAAAAWGSNPADFPYLTTVFTPYEDYRNVPNGKWESVILEEELLSYIAPTYLSRLTDGIADLDYTRENSGYIESMTVTDGQGNKIVLKNSGSVRSFSGSSSRAPTLTLHAPIFRMTAKSHRFYRSFLQAANTI